MLDGFVCLHRKSIDSRVFSDADLWKHWTWLLMRANFADGWFEGEHIPRGSLVTGTRSAAQMLGSSPATVHRQWKRFAEWGMIELKVKRGFTIITICGYATYNDQPGDSETPMKRQRNADETLVKHSRNADETLVKPIEQEQQQQPEQQEQQTPPTPRGGTRPLLDDPDDDPPPEKTKAEKAAEEAVQAWRELTTAWNATPGVRKCLAGNEARRKSLRVRLTERVLLDGKPVPWIQAAIAALQRKFPLKIREGDPDGWQPDIDWLLRPASVLKLLEGKYDWSKNDGRRPRDSGPGQRFDPATAGAAVEGW